MGSKIIKKLALSLFICLFAVSGWAADQADWPDIYIDESVAGGGVGSEADPYSDFSEINWTTGGDNSVFDYYAGAEAASLTINLQMGETWREMLTIGESGSASYPIVIQAYGSGDSPVISGADIEATWVSEEANIYTKDVGYIGGVVLENGTPLTFVEWDTDLATTLAAMSQGSYASDSKSAGENIYIWSTDDTDPDTHTIEVAKRDYSINGNNEDYITIDGIVIEGARRHGIYGADLDDWIITNVTVFNSGGYYTGAAYLGNGIEIGNNSSDIAISDSVIYKIFDSGVSPQISGGDGTISNVTINNLIIYDCGMRGVEIVIATDSDGSSSSIAGTTITNTKIYNTGKSWSGDRGGEGIMIYSDVNSDINTTTITQCDIYDNIDNGLELGKDSGVVTVNRTRIRDNATMGIYVTGAGDNPTDVSLIVNGSLIYGNTEEGLHFNSWNTTTPMTLRNNVFYNNGDDDNSDYNVAIMSNIGSEVIKNNIFSGTESISFWTDYDLNAGAGQDYNLFYRSEETETMITIASSGANDSYTLAQFATYQSAYSPDDANSVAANPLLTDPSNGDLTLKSTSPAIDAGALLTIHILGWQDNPWCTPSGYKSKTVLYGSGPDIGACETFKGIQLFNLFFPWGSFPDTTPFYN